MKLQDYTKNIHLLMLEQQMGLYAIPELPSVEFKKPVTLNKTTQVPNSDGRQVRRKLIDRGIEVTINELIADTKSLLVYKGQRVAAYIRDQKYDSEIERAANNFYHLCDCRIIRHARSHDKKRRYTATRRSDGFFKVNTIDGDNISTGLVKLDLCPHCRENLTFNSIYRHPFLLTDYFHVDEHKIPETIGQIEAVTVEEAYIPDMDDLLREYRKTVNDKCQLCGVSCSDAAAQDLLNLNFRDGNLANTQSSNLAILCHDCYSLQPGHQSRLRPNPEDLHRINMLRKTQGIISRAVFDFLTA